MATEPERPTPSMVGTGYANLAARLAELRRLQKEAFLREDYSRVDQLEEQIRQITMQMADAKAKGNN